MQRFLIPIISISLVSWSATTYIVFFTPPQSDLWALLFLSVLFFAIEGTLGLIVCMARSRLLPPRIGGWEEREILRESLKLSLPFSLGIFLFLFLRYFVAASKFNLVVLFLLLVSLEIYIIRRL